MLTIDARCRDNFCAQHKTSIYRMVGRCENCNTKDILVLLTQDHEKGYDRQCPVCGCRKVRPERLATEDEIPAA